MTVCWPSWTAVWRVDPRRDIPAPPESDDPGDDGPGDGGHWVTVATFWSPTEAHLARNVLEQHEIDAILLDEHVVATVSWYVGALGGIKLQVRAHQALRGRELLETLGVVRRASSRSCPHCQHTHLVLTPGPRWYTWVARLHRPLAERLFGTPVRCEDCGQLSWTPCDPD